jgi:hypothetical protein
MSTTIGTVHQFNAFRGDCTTHRTTGPLFEPGTLQ